MVCLPSQRYPDLPLLFQTTFENRGGKLFESVKWGLEAVAWKRSAGQFFFIEGQRCTANTGYSTWQKGPGASLRSCLPSTEFLQDVQ